MADSVNTLPVLEGTVEDYKGEPLPAAIKQRRGMQMAEQLRPEQVLAFLENLSKTGNYRQSSELAGLSYFTTMRLRKEEPEFQQWCDHSLQGYRESLVAEAHRRAIDGWDEPVFSQRMGTQMGVVRKYDSRLLELLLKRHIPEFREQFKGEITVSGGVLVAPIAPLSEEEYDQRFRRQLPPQA